MPQVGLHCVKGDVPHADCRACALDSLHPCMLTPDLLETLREKHDADVVYSPTRILGCHRRAVLEKATDYYTDIDGSYPLTRGNMVHALMERGRYPGVLGVIRELRLWTTVHTPHGDAHFGGKSDALVVTAQDDDGTLHVKVIDYKSKVGVGHDLVAASPDHVAQVNMYRWLVERELPAIANVPRVAVDEVEVMYCGLDKARRFTSAGALSARGKMLTRSPRTYATLTLAAIPLWPLDKVEAAIVAHLTRLLAPREGLPPRLPEEKQWQCASCAVNQVCWKKEND